MPVLKVENLVTTFRTDRGTLRAVDEVSFEIARGETLAIVGESGSGKSVTALSVMGLVPKPAASVEAGQVLFHGEDLLSVSAERMRDIRGNRIAMIFQEPMSSLNPALTVGMQVAEPLVVHRGKSWKSGLTSAEQLLDRVQIADAARRRHYYPHEFSGGMRQRVMIAMGLACEPELIIADEPTTALDVTVQAQVLDLLKDLTRNSGVSLILITHDLGVVARYADNVCVMYGGRIVESGPSEKIFEEPRHPYTKALLSSMPRLDQAMTGKLEAISGQPPDLAALPPGCAFEPRCKFAVEACRIKRPMLNEVAPKHKSACLLDGSYDR